MLFTSQTSRRSAQKLPEHANDINANTSAYIAKLNALDTNQSCTAELGDKRTVVTAHDVLALNAYGMNFLAPVGIDSEAEPSAQELGIIAYLRRMVAALFVENIESALVQQI